MKLHTKNKNVVHTAPMRRGVCFLVLGVLGALAAALGAGAAHADGTGTNPGTTTATTTATTTTTAAPTYARLAPSYLPATCVGAGAATIAEPGRRVLALGTPATSLGPSAYPAEGAALVAFDSATSSGSTCKTAGIVLESVSLLHGAVTATSVQATAGRGSTMDLEIDGSPAGLAPGQMTAIGNWAQLYLGKRVGRLAAPLVLVLLAPHDGLPAGTTITVAFAAAAQPTVTPAETQHSRTSTPGTATKPAAGSKGKIKQGQKRHRPKRAKPPDFPASPSPFSADGDFRDAVKDNPIVSTAMRYLGVPYQWGGANPATGFDCSGLVKYVFAQFGVPLVHYAAAQWHSPGGVWVPPDRLEAGDLVFFIGSDGTRKAPGHVGIYVGDGYFINAPHTGSFVRVDSLAEPKFARQYVGARKVATTQLLVARHPSDVTKPNSSATAFPLAFPSPITFIGLGEPLGVASAGAPTVQAASRGHWVWAGVGLGGVIALLSTVGGFTLRRRRRPGEETSS